MTRAETRAVFSRFPTRLTPLEARVTRLLDARTPPDSLVQDGRRRAEALGELLCGPSGIGGLRYTLIGSVARQTANAPISDVDVLVELDEADFRTRGGRKAPGTVLRVLHERLKQRYSDLEEHGHVVVRQQTHSSGLQFLSDRRVDIDVVPAFRVSEHLYEIPERGTRRWIQTSPARQVQTLDRLELVGRPVRQAVRLLRLWRRFGRSQPVPSMAMEVLALHARKHEASATALGLFEATLRWMEASRLREPIALSHQPLPRAALVIMDTGVAGNNLGRGVSAHQRDAMVARARETLQAFERAADRVSRGSNRGVEGALFRYFNIK